MTLIHLEDISFLLFVSVTHAFILAMNARRVGRARKEFGINPPELNGPGEFVRTVRAQSNDLEFGISFQIGLWTCGLTTHQGIAFILGIIFVVARYRYAVGYIRDAEKRLPGFRVSIITLSILYVFCCIGLVNLWMSQFLGRNLIREFGNKISGLYGVHRA